jgi:hypothetical protein
MTDPAWLVLSLALSAGGFFVLGRRAPAPGLTPAQSMLLLGGVGMLAGFWFDARAGNLAALAGICLGEKRGIAAMLALHWNQLPAMHLGMVAGSLATVPLLSRFGGSRLSQWRADLAQNLACSAWMFLGMAATTLFLELGSKPGGVPAAAAMVAAMGAGMAWGMVAGVSLPRVWAGVRSHVGAVA